MNVVPMQNARTRQEWADIINADWRKSIEGIIQTGRDLLTAKSELPHGEFMKLTSGGDLLFSHSTANALMSVANHPLIGNSQSTTNLPPSWAVLSTLARLSEDDFRDAENKGLVRPDTSLREARTVADAYRHKDSDKPIGEGRKPSILPTPSEARRVAKATGRLVAASDGNLYTGMSEAEGEDLTRRRRQTYGTIDAIKLLADNDDPARWVSDADAVWLHDFEFGTIDAAIDWLTELKTILADKLGVVDA